MIQWKEGEKKTSKSQERRERLGQHAEACKKREELVQNREGSLRGREAGESALTDTRVK